MIEQQPEADAKPDSRWWLPVYYLERLIASVLTVVFGAALVPATVIAILVIALGVLAGILVAAAIVAAVIVVVGVIAIIPGTAFLLAVVFDPKTRFEGSGATASSGEEVKHTRDDLWECRNGHANPPDDWVFMRPAASSQPRASCPECADDYPVMGPFEDIDHGLDGLP